MLQQDSRKGSLAGRTWRTWNHDELAHDLAQHLRANPETLAWENMQLGPSGSPRPDVYVIPRSYSRFRPLAYEIKVSTSDFRGDVTTGKWQQYLAFACGVIFAAPAGMLVKEDVPLECGLILRHEEAWRTVKKPTLRVLPTLDVFTWVKLLIDGVEREAGRRVPQIKKAGELNPWHVERLLRKRHGDKVAQLVSMAVNAEQKLRQMIAHHQHSEEKLSEEIRQMYDRARRDADKEQQTISQTMSMLAVELGLPADATQPQLISAIQNARNRLVGDKELQRMRRLCDRIQSEARSGSELLPGEAACAPSSR